MVVCCLHGPQTAGMASARCSNQRNYWRLCGRSQPEERSAAVGLMAQALPPVCRHLYRRLGGLCGRAAVEAASSRWQRKRQDKLHWAPLYRLTLDRNTAKSLLVDLWEIATTSCQRSRVDTPCSCSRVPRLGAGAP
jgi:redox-regulated HSP33 family molecular chaperone